MQRHTLILTILILFCLKGFSQKDIPIAYEIPKRGIYKTFEEFMFNRPGITDSFYLESKIRTQKNWEGTLSFTPRYADNDKKVKKIWGFSEGGNAYVFHQLEFFKIRLDSSKIGFYAYQQLDNSGAAAAGLLGGAIGGGIYAAVTVEKAKKKRIYYEFNFESRKRQLAKLILYRRAKKEKEEPLNITLNDSIEFQLIPNSVKEFDIPVSRDPVKICYGNNPNQCINLIIMSSENRYVEGSISSKSNEAKLDEVKVKVGKFYSEQVKYFQDKRENKDSK